MLGHAQKFVSKMLAKETRLDIQMREKDSARDLSLLCWSLVMVTVMRTVCLPFLILMRLSVCLSIV